MLSYYINGPFVEVVLDRTYPFPELRALYQSLRDDPAVPPHALLLIDASRRIDFPSEDETRARVQMFFELLCPRFEPVYAVVVSTDAAAGAKAAQRLANLSGLRVGLFLDTESARRWLRAYTPESPG